jgi:hypothetical protein
VSKQKIETCAHSTHAQESRIEFEWQCGRSPGFSSSLAHEHLTPCNARQGAQYAHARCNQTRRRCAQSRRGKSHTSNTDGSAGSAACCSLAGVDVVAAVAIGVGGDTAVGSPPSTKNDCLGALSSDSSTATSSHRSMRWHVVVSWAAITRISPATSCTAAVSCAWCGTHT